MINKENRAQQANAANSQQQTEQTMNAKPWSFHTGGTFGAPISRNVGSEVYLKLKENLSEIYKQVLDPNLEIALIDLDNANEPALVYSALIVAMQYKNDARKGVAYHVLILEATGEAISPLMENINGRNVEIMRTASDALDEVLLSKALERVRKAFPTGPHYNVDGVVIPLSFNADDKYAVHNLALSAGLACGTELEVRSPGFKDINLATAENDSTLNINIGFNRSQLEDSVGLNMRSDVLINFESRKNNQQNKYSSVNSGERETKISELSSFVDLLPIAAPGSSFNQYQQQQGQLEQKYAARMVITNLASNYSYTIGSVLLALVTALSLRDDNNWIQAFKPHTTGNNEIDMYDIGALNIEANIKNEATGYGTRIDTKSDSFKLEDLGQLVAALVRPGLMVSIDCPEAGAQSWYLSIFSAAATGSNNAYRAIVDAANALTNGGFGKYFVPGTDMFSDTANRIHNGNWTDKNGNKRDIRDIDHIAVCNLIGERSPKAITDWSDTFLQTQFPLQQRLDARKRMIQAMTNETAVFTGFSQRITFTAAFLDALSAGIRDTGMPVRINTPLSGSDFNNQRGVATFVNSALLSPGQSFTTPAGYNHNQNFGNFGNQNTRWR